MKPNPEAQLEGRLVLLKEENSGRDEMNLAGNPFALLQTGKSGQTVITTEWEKTLPNGKIVTASWEVSGHPTYGLPGPNDELLFLILMQLTREQSGSGEWVQKVQFSRFDLLNRLGWPNTATYYKMLKDGFTRLASVNIKACHTFWDAKVKAYADQATFHILEDSRFFDEPKGRKTDSNVPLSWFKWSDTVHQSFLAGNVRSLALNFIISLELPTTRRLFRYLDMMRSQSVPPRREFTVGLFKLSERLGMTSYKYASNIKVKLAPASDELVERGYLESYEYKKNKDGMDMAIYKFADAMNTKLAGQGRSEQARDSATPARGVKIKSKTVVASQLTLTDSSEEQNTDVRADAIRCHALFQSLKPSEQEELLTLAKADVSPIWHDRVGQPESPMSLGLWHLVAQRYPERLK